MLPVPLEEPNPGLVVSLRFRGASPEATAALLQELRDAVAVLATHAGFVDARLGRATDDADLIALQLGWTTVGAYRRALSSYEVKLTVVPLLSRAIDEPTAFEVLQVRDAHGTVNAEGALAADAGAVSLGSAAAAFVPPAPS